MCDVCDEHVTIVAFTGKEWCIRCKEIESEMQMLHARQGTQFHFRQMDTSDQKNLAVIEAFAIKSFPTILIYDPKTRTAQKYAGERSAHALELCASDPSACSLVAFEAMSSFTHVAHTHMQQTNPTPPVLGPLELCSNEITVLAFTGRKWCPHCIAVQPTLTQWKNMSLAELGFRFQQFDTDDAVAQIERFDIQEYPTFLIFDPSTRIFKRFLGDVASLPGSNLRQVAGPVWATVPEEVRLVSCMAAGASTMVVAVQVGPPSVEMHMCAQCPTLLAFTGDTWCDPCKAFASDMNRLKRAQQHGAFHLLQYDRPVDSADCEGTEMCETFGVKHYPTFLLFNPYDRTFYEHRGLRTADALMRCDIRGSKVWPSPPNLRLVLDHDPVRVTNVKVHVEAETNGDLHLCGTCPTALAFCLNENDLALLLPASKPSLHVERFCVARHGYMIDLFGVATFPTVLVYLPDQRIFVVYEGTVPTTSAVLHFLSYKNLKKQWKMHPRIVHDTSAGDGAHLSQH